MTTARTGVSDDPSTPFAHGRRDRGGGLRGLKGELTRGATGDFGFARMVQKVQAFTSGQKADVLVPAICQARAKVNRRVLETLARSHRSELRQREVEEIAEAIPQGSRLRRARRCQGRIRRPPTKLAPPALALPDEN